jgi:hypothetical protein
MKKVVLIMSFVLGLIILASCGTELPEGLDNVEINKDSGKGNDPSTPDNNIPSENDNPLPSY